MMALSYFGRYELNLELLISYFQFKCNVDLLALLHIISSGSVSSSNILEDE